MGEPQQLLTANGADPIVLLSRQHRDWLLAAIAKPGCNLVRIERDQFGDCVALLAIPKGVTRTIDAAIGLGVGVEKIEQLTAREIVAVTLELAPEDMRTAYDAIATLDRQLAAKPRKAPLAPLPEKLRQHRASRPRRSR